MLSPGHLSPCSLPRIRANTPSPSLGPGWSPAVVARARPLVGGLRHVVSSQMSLVGTVSGSVVSRLPSGQEPLSSGGCSE